MKYLFVLDNCKKYCGANINIAVKLANELRNRGHKVFLVVGDCHKENDSLKLSLFDDYALVKTYDFSGPKTTNWTLKNKIFYGISHPLFVLKWAFSKRKNADFRRNIHRIEKKENIDCIIGFSSPFYISRIVSKQKSKARKLIIQLDPYTNNTTLPELSKIKRKKDEEEMLKGIDFLLAATPHFSELCSIFSEYKEKIKELELPVMVELKTAEKSTRNDDLVKFAYTGMLYRDIRNPEYMLNLFKYLPSNYHIEIAGKGEEILIANYEDVLGSKMNFHGVLSSEEAQKLCFDCDFLINLNNSIYNQLPSKLYEYISSGYPVINICKLRDCPSLRYTKKYENVVDIFETDSLEYSAGKIVNFVKTNMGKIISYSEIENAFAKNTISYAGNYIDEIVCGI